MADTDSSCTKGAAAGGNAVENLQEEATCSICLDYFKDPVMTKCGHNFCRGCIGLCWQNLDSSFTCPQCRKRSHKPLLTPNRQLACMVKIAQELTPNSYTLQQDTQCEKHGEKLKLFCEDDQKAICIVCDRAREHRAHTVVPITDAVQECKEKLHGHIVPLKKKLENVLNLINEEERKPTELKVKVEVEKKNILSKFEELHRLLNEEKRMMLVGLEERKTELLNRIRTNIIQLSEQSSTLQLLIKEVDVKGHQINLDMLKDMKCLLTRCDNAMGQISPTVSSDLQKGINNIPVQYAAVKNMLNKLTAFSSSEVHFFIRTVSSSTSVQPSTSSNSVSISDTEFITSAIYAEMRSNLTSSAATITAVTPATSESSNKPGSGAAASCAPETSAANHCQTVQKRTSQVFQPRENPLRLIHPRPHTLLRSALPWSLAQDHRRNDHSRTRRNVNRHG
ncbi:E3 ubiquitin-protein ligase TRIM39-like isoform X2 [Rhinatrema bivittatum]|uniref:E3 ubiquitin-protein ligase TRIM39-like isoform X2 n=1 Tax=Rhinatrema bivittatum TaxID=194408 RepID=UPI0011286F88|nr:E3 ubiquitin-protein ligase TRIM39-like isoform X2 [Rhinatrema bivittatum]